jgi:hypothetical protein
MLVARYCLIIDVGSTFFVPGLIATTFQYYCHQIAFSLSPFKKGVAAMIILLYRYL